MPTEKPRITITMSEKELEAINTYRFENRCKNQTQAILGLISAGLEALNKDDADSPPAPEFDPDKARLLELFEELNIDGRERLLEIADAMVKSGKYAAPAVPAPAEYIRLYRTPAAAGFASPVEGSDYTLIPRDKKTPRNADFAVRIQGSSMSPYIKDGDTVYVQRDTSLEDFDVGIFYLDGDMYCKQICVDHYGNVYLLSANPKKENLNKTVSHDSTSTLICYGKVILPHKLPPPTYHR